MPTDEDRAKIDEWVAVAPDSRIVETTRAGDGWATQALEDGEVRYEEAEVGGDEPLRGLLVGWCARQNGDGEPRLPVKASGVHLERWLRGRLS